MSSQTVATRLRPRLIRAAQATAIAAATLAATTTAAHAGDGQRATPDEARAMVRKAVAHIKTVGAARGHADINHGQGGLVDRDLYVVVYGLDGRCLAHGANPRQIGRDLIDLTDIDGKPFVRERVALARAHPQGFWQDYKFTNPVSRRIEAKTMYCEKLGETAVCAGVYAPR
jgi:signal transduction histidine kinase